MAFMCSAERNHGTWSQQAAGFGDPQSQGFGISTALFGDTARLALDPFPEGVSYAGAAYVFTRTGTTGPAQLIADGASAAILAVGRDGRRTAVVGAENAGPGGTGGAGEAYVFEFGIPNVPPTFVGATTEFNVLPDSAAADVKALLHVSDTDTGQTLTWTQSSGPSKGALSFSGATASSGATDIAPGGTITYTPTAGAVGADSFTVRQRRHDNSDADPFGEHHPGEQADRWRQSAGRLPGRVGGGIGKHGFVGAQNVRGTEERSMWAPLMCMSALGMSGPSKPLDADDGAQHDSFGARVALHGIRHW